MKFSTKNAKTVQNVLLDNFGDDRVKVSNKYMTVDGIPVIPVMGELHYSRVPEERWDEELKKMKEGGIDVVASYVFWIHHEEMQGVFDFSGNRNIRRFIELCYKNGLQFCLRIGPWAHGECRNGGFPDWLYPYCGNSVRSLREPFYSCVSRYIEEIGNQIKGLPLFAIQIENECYNKDVEYYEGIRKLCIANGMTAPLYTATGWGNAVLPETLLPMFGGYPSEPWTQNVLPETPNANYFFADNRSGGKIGSDLDGVSFVETVSYVGRMPYFTCELGGGNQVTYHRRPMFVPEDIEALPVCKLGSGCNLIGYFMYHGGLNPIGKTTMQESKATKYINDYPVISYDFQSPIGDNGQIRESYYRLKSIHRFIHTCGSILAPMDVYYPDVAPVDVNDETTLRASLRSDGERGFIFVCNHVRLKKRQRCEAEIVVELNDRTVSLTLDVPEDSSFIIPVGHSYGSLKTDYITAMPVLGGDDGYAFMKIANLTPVVVTAEGKKYALSVGDNIIEGVNIILEEEQTYEPTPLDAVGVTEQASTVSPDVLLSHLDVSGDVSEYGVKWAAGTKYLVIKAFGNIAGFFVNGRLVNDFYLYNRDGKADAFVVDVRPFETNEGVLKLLHFNEEEAKKVYMDGEIKVGKIAPEVFCTADEILKI